MELLVFCFCCLLIWCNTRSICLDFVALLVLFELSVLLEFVISFAEGERKRKEKKLAFFLFKKKKALLGLLLVQTLVFFVGFRLLSLIWWLLDFFNLMY